MRQYIYTYKYEYIFLCASLYCSKLNNFPSGMLGDEGCFKWRSLCPGIYNIQTPIVCSGGGGGGGDGRGRDGYGTAEVTWGWAGGL